MPVLGDIATKARERIPSTWHALAKHQQFGEPLLQGRVDAVKHELFGEVVDPNDELTSYGPIGTDYAGVVVALALVPAGYDHWMTAATSWSATGKNENKTFIDRAQALLKLRDEVLIPEERRLYGLVAPLLPGVLPQRRGGIMQARTPVDAEHVTPDPLTFEPAFERPRVVA